MLKTAVVVKPTKWSSFGKMTCICYTIILVVYIPSVAKNIDNKRASEII